MIAEILPEIKISYERSTFTYQIPPFLHNLKIGSVVLIPLQKKVIRGVVVSISDQKPSMKLREILDRVENFTLSERYIGIAKWISDYYLCTPGEAITLFLPPNIKNPRANKEKTAELLGKSSEISLNTEQEKIYQELKERLNQRDKKPALIHGVTGSGKTEIYLKLAEETIKNGRQVVVLVPEIVLTPQTVDRFEEYFGSKIALMHSNLSKSEKWRCYHEFLSGEKQIIIGPRSALLVPNDKIGLIVIDEEQEDSYKQDQTPRYHAVDLAAKIAEESNALLIMGSATPRVETYFYAKSGKYSLFELTKRYHEQAMPKAVVIDLKQECRNRNYSVLSTRLKTEIEAALARKKQIFLFLNRRGIATFVSCRECGEVIICPNCLVSLVYYIHKNNGILSCHHCGYEEKVPAFCPKCQSPKIKFFGAGIDRIEQEITKEFPSATIFKADSTTLKNKRDYDKFYRLIKSGQIDIAIGTQLLAKGFDLENVGLVGVVSADTGLHLPQFRASERSFQLITQVSGRSGRRTEQGLTIIQSYWPDHNAITHAAAHDYSGFYEKEIADRKKFDYPPYCRLIRVVSEDLNEDRARKSIEKVATELSDKKFFLIGPGPCFYSKLHRKFRYHLVIKVKADDPAINEIRNKFNGLIWDANPVNLL